MVAHSISACPACNAAPIARAVSKASSVNDARIVLSVPTVHCAACMRKIEQHLEQLPGVDEARVNLSLKRCIISGNSYLQSNQLINAIKSLGYPAEELDAKLLEQGRDDPHGRALLTRLAVAGFAMMNVMLLSISVWAGAEGQTRDMFHWVSAMIAIPATLYAAMPFFLNAWSVLRHARLNMDVPISLAILLALGTSIWETTLSGEHAYFDAAIALTFFLLIGRYLDHRTRSIARSAAQELTALEVHRAEVVVDGEAVIKEYADIKVGDQLVVRAGMRVPVDGVAVGGQADIDRALITGETQPVFVTVGDAVQAGALSTNGQLIVRATAVGEDTSLHQMADLVAIAESGRSKYTPIADKAAALYAPGVHILSAISFVGWYLFSGDLRMALNIAAAVLIITCPCALGLAVPAVTTAASGQLFSKGLLMKSSTALERLAEVDHVVFDKTGTLTTGLPKLVNDIDMNDEERSILYALSNASKHPLARVLAQTLKQQGAELVALESIQEVPGLGVEAKFQNDIVRLGRADWVGAISGARTATFYRRGNVEAVEIEFVDNLRNGAQRLIAEFYDLGISVEILSGDTAAAVIDVADQLKISNFSAGVTPVEKYDRLRSLKADGHRVLMIGDGLNDTAALAEAHVSISPSSALDAARSASDIVFLGENLDQLLGLIPLATASQKRIKENFRIATFYNVIAVPVAIAGFATPLIAALAMSLSSISVTLNALRIR